MRPALWLRILALTALVATACATGNPSATKPGASPGTRLQNVCRAVQPVPQFPASPTSKTNLVLGTLLGSDRTVVRDITDITHPKTIITSAISSTIPRL